MLKEQLWVNCSGHSWQMSDREQFAQVAYDIWAIQSKNLTEIAFLVRVFCTVHKKEQFPHSLFFHEWCEQIAQIAHQKWATMSKWLRSLTKSERIARFLSKSLIRSFFCKELAICTETDKRISSPELFKLCDQISWRNGNWIQKYFSLFIRDPDGFKSWKKWRSKISRHTSFK